MWYKNIVCSLCQRMEYGINSVHQNWFYEARSYWEASMLCYPIRLYLRLIKFSSNLYISFALKVSILLKNLSSNLIQRSARHTSRAVTTYLSTIEFH